MSAMTSQILFRLLLRYPVIKGTAFRRAKTPVGLKLQKRSKTPAAEFQMKLLFTRGHTVGLCDLYQGALDGHARTNNTTSGVDGWKQQTQQTETTKQGLKVDGPNQHTETETETTNYDDAC